MWAPSERGTWHHAVFYDEDKPVAGCNQGVSLNYSWRDHKPGAPVCARCAKLEWASVLVKKSVK